MSLAVALLAPLILPLLAMSAEFEFTTLVLVKLYLLTFVLLMLAATLNEMLRLRAVNASDDATYEEDLGGDDGREEGVVKWFNVNKGFGFIIRDAGGEVFVHFRSIRGTGHRTLREGQRVKFAAVDGDKGLQAEDVSILSR
ncbi:cold-shock protein [Marinospirillum alkaliphilum]|uniref:cold-shock protein n=1 Tax=Marinospirillum alkaliphilum TaxID=148454 RepID=UPI0024819E0D|nr:cold shock domain-containing protein [Marinospirillum alkaliphilum]